MVFIAMMFLLKVKPRILTEWAPDWENHVVTINYHCVAVDDLGFECSDSSEARAFNSLSIVPDN